MATGIGDRLHWIDWGHHPRSARLYWEARRYLAPLVVGLVLSALVLVALRAEILRLRYELTDAHRAELRLDKQKAKLAARYWGLRDPMRLAAQAEAQGFAKPGCVIDLSKTRQAPGCNR